MFASQRVSNFGRILTTNAWTPATAAAEAREDRHTYNDRVVVVQN